MADGSKNSNGGAKRPRVHGRFDLIPPGAERRLAALYERDATAFGLRDWEGGGIPLSEFVNLARDALNRLHARDVTEDWPARVAWAMLGYMRVEAEVRAGRLSADLADMPEVDPELLPAAPRVTELGAGSQPPALSAPVDDTPPVPPPMPLLGPSGKV